VILITDAEDLDDQQAAIAAVKNLAKNKIQVDVVGVGSSQPVTIPTPDGPFTDDQGQVVQTALNEQLAAELAKAGGGVYVNASGPDALPDLQRQLDTLQKRSMEGSRLALHEELYHIFLWIALGLLIADALILDRSISWLDRINFFRK